MPPRKRITAIREVQPDVGLPKMRVRTTTKKVISRERKQDRRPATKAIVKGNLKINNPFNGVKKELPKTPTGLASLPFDIWIVQIVGFKADPGKESLRKTIGLSQA